MTTVSKIWMKHVPRVCMKLRDSRCPVEALGSQKSGG